MQLDKVEREVPDNNAFRDSYSPEIDFRDAVVS